jgi:hypothetical protein
MPFGFALDRFLAVSLYCRLLCALATPSGMSPRTEPERKLKNSPARPANRLRVFNPLSKSMESRGDCSS